ncbi:uncharacterized protein PFL1_00425 [Pseudozyma flocculosa PF-1]|uniref:Related to NADH oxidase n=1 Tax=Pseudozyma flocculosa TaxID=84751 RepID=A0A5C3ER52_9BASI|nr:uncharacterized protein PFL1_00425 [Pseudozyma flocculosa PF-1]EPQ32228.1 hypothetical protein PFL1_00425 [Pseudozyma flocculosa PF-1]SPO34824.1 related to NADH oxidase [Pseudozyma flocculosa]
MSKPSAQDQIETIARPLTFARGKRAPNRLAKAPMEEMLAQMGGGPPTPAHLELYRSWARGGWGMVITGNVAIDNTHLGTPFDVTTPPDSANAAERQRFKQAFKLYADAVTGRDQADVVPSSQRPLGVVQLVHAGRQSMRGSGRGIMTDPIAPSTVPMRPTAHLGPFGTVLDKVMWGTPIEMSLQQVQWLKNRFIEAAKLCEEAGFDGVELHASHGYMLAAFLSPLTNTRKDQYGGGAENRARLLLEIVDGVRAATGDDFLVGVKLNSSDYVQGGLTEEDALLNVRWLAENGGVDFVEISGGNYENPSFVMEGFDSEAEKAKVSGKQYQPKTSKRTAAREAFFASFSRQCRSVVTPPSSSPEETRLKLILTGGLRTRAGIASVLSPSSDPDNDGAGVDMACLGRPAALYPDLPRRLLDPALPDMEADTPRYTIPAVGALGLLPIKLVGAGWGTMWHSLMMAQIAIGSTPDPKASVIKLFRDLAGAPTGKKQAEGESQGAFLLRWVAIIVVFLAVGQGLLFSYLRS